MGRSCAQRQGSDTTGPYQTAVGRDPAEVSITAFTGSRDADSFAAFEAAGVDRLVVTMASTPDRKPFEVLAIRALSAGR